MTQPESEYLYRVGIDWATQQHQVWVVDREGQRTESTVPHTSAGLTALADKLTALSRGSRARRGGHRGSPRSDR